MENNKNEILDNKIEYDKLSPKEIGKKILGWFAGFWMKIIPMLLIVGFFIGLGFCMVNIWGWSLWVAILIDSLLGIGVFIGFMKLLKIF